jgi:NADH-quinone oxidoreductase subunit L
MVLGLGSGAFAAGIFHLMTHAFFKALLFLGAGSVIHALADEQDLRRMGGLRRYLPITTTTFLVAWLAIIGFPGFSGFFSKDLILSRTFERGAENPWYFVLYGVGLLTVALTAFYMSRLVFLAFFGDYRGAVAGAGATVGAAAMAAEHEPVAAAGHAAIDHGTGADTHGSPAAHGAQGGRPHESPWVMTIPLIVLAIFSLIAGWVGIPPTILSLIGAGGGELSWFEQFLEPSLTTHAAVAAPGAALEPWVELALTGASVAMALIGVGIAALMYLAHLPDPAALTDALRTPYTWLRDKWYVDELYQALIAHPGARLASFLAAFDLGVVDGAVNGVARLARGTGSVLRRTQTGYVRSYAVTMLIGAFAVLAYWAFR